MKESLGGRPRAVQGKGRHERGSVEIHRLVMISELLSAIHRVDAGVNWIRVAAFLHTVTGSWYVFLLFVFSGAMSWQNNCAVGLGKRH